jgi:isocitrate dehydrogenase
MQTITDGVVTGDLAALMDPKPQAVTSEEFIGGIRERLAKKLGC